MIDEKRGKFLRNFAVEAIDDGLKKNFTQLFYKSGSVVDGSRATTYSIGQGGSPVRLDIRIEQYMDDIIHMRFDYSSKYGDPLGLNYDEFFPYGIVEDESLFGGYVERYVKTYVGMAKLDVNDGDLRLQMELGGPKLHLGDYDKNLSKAYGQVLTHTIMKLAKRFDTGFEVLKFTCTKENVGFHDNRLRELPFGAFSPDFPEYTTLRSYDEDISIDFVTIFHDIQLSARYTVYDDETGNGVAFKEKKVFGSRGWDEKSFATKVSEWFEGFMEGYLEKRKALPSHEEDDVCSVRAEDVVDFMWSMKKRNEDVRVQKKA